MPSSLSDAWEETSPVGVSIVVTGWGPTATVGEKVLIAVLVKFSLSLFDRIYSSIIFIDLLDVMVIPSRFNSDIAINSSST